MCCHHDILLHHRSKSRVLKLLELGAKINLSHFKPIVWVICYNDGEVTNIKTG